MKHIGTKLFAAFLCMTALTVAILWIVQAGIMRNSYLDERVKGIDRALGQAIDSGSVNYTDLEEALDINLMAVDAQGGFVYVSQGMPMRGMMIKNYATMDRDRNGLRYFSTMASQARYAVLSLESSDGVMVHAVFSMTNVEEAASILRRQLWIVTLVLLAFSIGLAVFLSRRFAGPVREITGAARRMSQGQLDVVLPVRSKDEIGQLTQALNDLCGQLRITEELRKELIANVSHELRAPLSVIRGYAETVRDVTWPVEEKRSEQLTLIADEATRLSGIVSDILNYSRLQAGVVKPVPKDFKLVPALAAAKNRYEDLASKRNVSMLILTDDVIVRFDAAMFDQVLDNLLSNAVNHADEGSSIEIFAQKAAEAMRIGVKNRGDTIPEAEQPRIWERFYRIGTINENRRLGTGLGLAIVKSMLEVHGVAFGVQSANGETVFWFETQPVR
jgi:signal transduction histidine kinase